MNVTRSKSLKPFVKWAGGKQALSSLLVSFFPKDIDCFWEPFVGGGSVYFTLQPAKAVIADKNAWLIDTYKAVRSDWSKVAEILSRLVNTKQEFLKIRAVSPSSLDSFHRAAHFIYLNKTCFRGLFRVNGKGQFNVPYGSYQRRLFDPANLEAVSKALKRAEIRCGDFEANMLGVSTNDFAYLDPPYYKLGGYSDFNRYTAAKFKEAEHIRLAALCRELDELGVRWAVSNSNTAFVRQLFHGFQNFVVRARREINLRSHDRDISELLITNYLPPSEALRAEIIEKIESAGGRSRSAL